MIKSTLKNLERYKERNSLSDRALARKLKVHHVYIYRWRKAEQIIGAYQRIVDDFLAKEVEPSKRKEGNNGS